MHPLTRTDPFLRGLLVWVEAPHEGSARSLSGPSILHQSRPLIPIRVLFGNRIDLTLLAAVQKSFQSLSPH